MAAYGWTLDEALSHTLPQMMLLIGAMKRWPPINLIAPVLLKSIGDGKEGKEKAMLDKLKGINKVNVAESKEAQDLFSKLAAGGSLG